MNNVCVHMHIYMGFLLWVDCVLQWIPVYILRTISFQEITIFLLSFSRHENCFKKTSSRNKIMKGMMMREYFHTCWFVHTHLHLNRTFKYLIKYDTFLVIVQFDIWILKWDKFNKRQETGFKPTNLLFNNRKFMRAYAFKLDLIVRSPNVTILLL